jgi:hypothetical protein
VVSLVADGFFAPVFKDEYLSIYLLALPTDNVYQPVQKVLAACQGWDEDG